MIEPPTCAVSVCPMAEPITDDIGIAKVKTNMFSSENWGFESPVQFAKFHQIHQMLSACECESLIWQPSRFSKVRFSVQQPKEPQDWQNPRSEGKANNGWWQWMCLEKYNDLHEQDDLHYIIQACLIQGFMRSLKANLNTPPKLNTEPKFNRVWKIVSALEDNLCSQKRGSHVNRYSRWLS